ncbi:hypothetical protein RRG08_035235 [Elysia crispata]|uniref:Uncharacterized protein n=1 Tax=Elysia crispata TaxID=231223 RepID=A0AAE0ZN11_9GAST|nr:hypothetical protein RRG08_035235 [Elysia crispata]
MSSYHLLIAPPPLRESGLDPTEAGKDTLNEKPTCCFASRNFSHLGRTPLAINLAASRVGHANPEATGGTSNEKPVNTSPGQRVDGRPKPASIMTVQQKGGRISQGLKGDPFRGDISATLSPTERRTPFA